MIITIDGPAGAGKSTLSIGLAKKLGFFCLNSGYLYRGMAYVLQTYYGYAYESLYHPNIDDIVACIESGKFRYEYEQGIVTILFGDIDITLFLKHPNVAKGASILAQVMAVRSIIRAYKRKLVQGRDAIAEGRVCGAVVFPNADLKLYVTATEQVRAERFVQDQAKRGNRYTKQEALQLIIERDQKDMTRIHDALVVPKDGIVLDTSELSKEEALNEAVNLARKALKKEI